MIPINEALTKEEDKVELKALKDYALVRGELYSKMLGGSCLDAWGKKRPKGS